MYFQDNHITTAINTQTFVRHRLSIFLFADNYDLKYVVTHYNAHGAVRQERYMHFMSL